MAESKSWKLSSNGNVVNVGNFDENGVNVDNDNPRNENDNLGVRFSRSVDGSPPYSAGFVFNFLIQPPSMRPRISVVIEEEVFQLHQELGSSAYRHAAYTHFVICDPKRRDVY